MELIKPAVTEKNDFEYEKKSVKIELFEGSDSQESGAGDNFDNFVRG